MKQLLDFDKANPKIPRHRRPSSSDDEFETPRTRYYQNNIENETVCFVGNHPIGGSITFLKDGKPTKDSSRNAYVCVIWRKR